MTEMTFSQKEKQEILTFVRNTIASKFEDTNVKALGEMDGKMAEMCSCFVTLHKPDGALRGCIGNIAAHEALSDNIAHNAINSAFGDPRFPNLAAEELDDVEIEVEKNQIIIRPLKNARAGWDAAFKIMAEKGDDELMIDKNIINAWDEEEWQW